MRSLEECKNEIFRRSEMKIKRRKQIRNHVVAVCLPLCLCLSGAVIWEMGQQKDSRAVESAAPESVVTVEDFNLMNQEMEVSATWVTGVAIDNRKSNDSLSDAITAQEQYQYVLALYQKEPIKSSNHPTKHQPEVEETRITFYMSDNSQVTYVLKENTLTCLETGKTLELDAEDLQELKELMGIERKDLS